MLKYHEPNHKLKVNDHTDLKKQINTNENKFYNPTSDLDVIYVFKQFYHTGLSIIWEPFICSRA